MARRAAKKAPAKKIKEPVVEEKIEEPAVEETVEEISARSKSKKRDPRGRGVDR